MLYLRLIKTRKMVLYLLLRQQMNRLGLNEKSLAGILKISEVKTRELLTDLRNTHKYDNLEKIMIALDCFEFSGEYGAAVQKQIEQEYKSLLERKTKTKTDQDIDKYMYC